jgi:WD40 repeat protein
VCSVPSGPCEELRGHQGIVRDLAFSSDDDTLVTASGDGTVQVWDLLTRERRVLEGHVAPIFDLEVAPDGRSVATAGGDAVIRLWPIRVPPSPNGLRAFLDGLTTESISEGLPGATED